MISVELINICSGEDTDFDSIINEVEASCVPSKYVDHIEVNFRNDENTLTLTRKEINHPLPGETDLNKIKWNELQKQYRKIKNVQIFININDVKNDVNKKIDKLFYE